MANLTIQDQLCGVLKLMPSAILCRPEIQGSPDGVAMMCAVVQPTYPLRSFESVRVMHRLADYVCQTIRYPLRLSVSTGEWRAGVSVVGACMSLRKM
jgi:hypothetical protein